MAFQPINVNNITNNNDTQIEQEDEIKTDLSQWNTHISNHQPGAKFTFNPNNIQQPAISASQPVDQPAGQTIGQQLGLHMAYQNNKSTGQPIGIKLPASESFKFSSSSTIPIPTAHPNPMVFGCLGPPRVERHPETGQIINQPSQGNYLPFGQNDKKKLIASLYAELSNIRSQIEKLNKSTDMIYEILRDI
jgi:hypothetical protein